MLKNPRGDNGAGTYLQLEGADIQLYELMDGTRTVRAILLAHLSYALLAPLVVPSDRRRAEDATLDTVKP